MENIVPNEYKNLYWKYKFEGGTTELEVFFQKLYKCALNYNLDISRLSNILDSIKYNQNKSNDAYHIKLSDLQNVLEGKDIVAEIQNSCTNQALQNLPKKALFEVWNKVQNSITKLSEQKIREQFNQGLEYKFNEKDIDISENKISFVPIQVKGFL